MKRRRYTSCPNGGKRGFDTPKAALRANKRNGKRLRAYLCPSCRRYHVTTQRKP